MKHLYTLVIFLLLTLSALGQGVMVRGTVVDVTKNEPIMGATIRFIGFRDTTQVTYAITDYNGFFKVEGLRGRGIRMEISSVGFETYHDRIRLGQDIDLGMIKMQESTKVLDNVNVEGTAIRSEQQGDTTVFRADAYQTMPDATAEDLVGKLPGVMVESGTVQAQGENVQQVLVDGRRFFTTDPTLALRSLPAEVIAKIEVFDQQSEQSQFTGFNDGNTQKTMNLVTREKARVGQFGKVYAGYGLDNKYKAGGSVNFFNQERRIALIGQSNNINQQNFSAEDILGVTGGSGGGRGRRGGRGGVRGGGGSDNFLLNQQDGISTTHALGLNYTDVWGEKTRVEGTYFFSNRRNVTEQILSQTYFTGRADGQIYTEESSEESVNSNHRVNARVEYTANRTNSLVWRPSVRLQSSELDYLLFGSTQLGAERLGSAQSHYGQESSGINTTQSLLWRHRFAKFGRTLSVNFSGGLNTNLGLSQLKATNKLIAGGLPATDSLLQQTQGDQLGYSGGVNVSFTESLTRTSQLSVDVSTNYQNNAREQLTYNYNEIAGDFTELDEPLSTDFTNGYWTHRAGTGYRHRLENGAIMARVYYQYATLNNQQVFPTNIGTDMDFHNVLPSLNLNLRLGENSNLRVGYRTSTQAPTATQLVSVVDNANPLQWSAGNPALDQSYQHRIFARFGKSNTEKGSTFFALLSASTMQQYITQATYLPRNDTSLFGIAVPRGQQLSVPINMDGYWLLRSFATIGVPLTQLKSNLNFNLGASYSVTPGMINGLVNTTQNSTLMGGLVLSSNISERIDFSVSTRTNFTITENALQPDLDNTLLNQLSSVRFNWAISEGIIYRTQWSHQLYQGLSADLDQSVMLWNMSLGYRFLKDRRGELALEVFDLLNQNTALERNVTDIYLEDVQTNVLQRFFLLTFTYNLRAFGSRPQENPEGSPGRRRGFGGPPRGFHN